MDNELLMRICFILCMEYLLVLIAAMADLWSGLRKATQRGEVHTSYGLRRTVDKLSRYYNVLMAVTVVDCMQIIGVHYLDIAYGYNVPVFPIMTFFTSIGLGLIEIKSIYEKAEDKDKDEFHQVARLASEIARHKTDPDEIAQAVVKYIKQEKYENIRTGEESHKGV